MAKGASLSGVALLVAFHGWLFAGRLAGGELLEPAVALRWIASVLLVIALLGLRRAGVPLIRGRKALVFWVLVLLLHWTATPLAERGLPVNELLIAAPGVITLAVGVGLVLATVLVRRRVRPPRMTRIRPLPPTVTPVLQCLLTVHAARPPPA
jgi:FtsH-binding integral membrane protein